MAENNIESDNGGSVKHSEDKEFRKKTDTEYSNDFTADGFINPESLINTENNSAHYVKEIHAMPESIKALIIISWICAALAGFVSIYFAIVGIVSAYAANRALPGAGRAALITNIILAVINLVLSFAFMETVGNIFA